MTGACSAEVHFPYDISVYVRTPRMCADFIRLILSTSITISGRSRIIFWACFISLAIVICALKGFLSTLKPSSERRSMSREWMASRHERPGLFCCAPIHQSSWLLWLKRPVELKRISKGGILTSSMIFKRRSIFSSGVSPRKAIVRCKFSRLVKLPLKL